MDLLSEYRAMIDLARAGRFADAVCDADRILLSAGELATGDWSVLEGVMMTRLDIKSRLQPDPSLVDDCEALFARCRDTSTDVSALSAVGALRLELLLLLDDPQDERIDDVVKRLQSFYEQARKSPFQEALGKGVLQAIDQLTGRGHPYQAVPLAREVVDRLGASDSDDERQLAARAQVWVVLALTFSGEPSSLFGSDMNLPEIVAAIMRRTDDELRELGGVFIEFERCCELGEAGLSAADSLLAEFKERDGWTNAEFVVLIVRYAILDHLGRTDDAEHALRALGAFIDSGAVPGIQELPAELRD